MKPQAGPPVMADYDDVLAEFKKHLMDLGASSDIASWQEIVVHNFLFNFVLEAGYLLVKR
jgi:hypothetical protein